MLHSSLSVGRPSLRFRSSLHTFTLGARFMLFFKKIFYYLAPSGCPILKVFFKAHSRVWAGAYVVSRIISTALRRSSSALFVYARHSNRHTATRSLLRFAPTSLRALTWGVIIAKFSPTYRGVAHSALAYKYIAV